MLNQTAEYALRAVLHLASAEGDGPLRVDAVAADLDVPRNYLSKVMHLLARSGLLRSARGPAGGFTLARPPEEITLAQVIDPFDRLEDRCLLMRRTCSDADPCLAHHQWKHVAVQLRSFFRETTVADLVRGAGNVPGAPAGWMPPT
jgi:Rrf2 family protein